MTNKHFMMTLSESEIENAKVKARQQSLLENKDYTFQDILRKQINLECPIIFTKNESNFFYAYMTMKDGDKSYIWIRLPSDDLKKFPFKSEHIFYCQNSEIGNFRVFKQGSDGFRNIDEPCVSYVVGFISVSRAD